MNNSPLDNMFVIAGAQRSGTTYLYQILDSHPEIYMAKPMRPEPKFFCIDENFNKGKDYYIKKYFHDLPGHCKAAGEKSTSYMSDPKTPERMASLFPNMKIIFVLRNPIERAISNYWFSVQNNLEKESFEYAVKNEKQRILSNPMPQFSNHPFAYLERGEYITYIERYLKYFPQEQLFFIKSEDLEKRDSLAQLFSFLEVDDTYYPAEIGRKINDAERKHEVLTPELKAMLVEHFRESNERLQEKINMDLSDWNNY